MVEAKRIETLSVLYTAGVIAGGMVTGGAAWGLSAALLPLSASILPFRKRLMRWPEKVSVPLILTVFFLLGVLSALLSSLPSVSSPPFWEAAAERACSRLKGLIADIPFPSVGTAPLVTALLTGDRSGLAPDTVSAFRTSGASHILALSGLHLGILYLLLDKITSLPGRFPSVRIIRFCLLLAASGGFTLLTGCSPSLVRAFLFIMLNEILRLTGRPRNSVRVLCLALLIQLILDPGAVRSIGFQLSYLAMAGIFLINPILEEWYPESPAWDPFRRIWKAAALSISCQVTTAPIAWLHFHTFPRYFLITNLTAMPLTTLLMGSAFFTVILSGLGACPPLLVTVTDTLCNWLQGVLRLIASL